MGRNTVFWSGSRSATFSENWARLARNRSNSTGVGPTRPRLAPNLCNCDDIGLGRPKLGRVLPIQAEVDQVGVGQTWPEIGQQRPHLAQGRPTLDRNRPTFPSSVKIGPSEDSSRALARRRGEPARAATPAEEANRLIVILCAPKRRSPSNDIAAACERADIWYGATVRPRPTKQL